jgi:hypothetical protein
MPLDAWVRIGLLLALACALLYLAWWILTQLRVTPTERERRRRDMVNRVGRTHDAFLTDISPELLTYQYSVNGVDYSASQDIANLAQFISDDPANLIGHVNIKYAPRNPANSILLCEGWSGLRTSHQYRQAEAARISRAARENLN